MDGNLWRTTRLFLLWCLLYLLPPIVGSVASEIIPDCQDWSLMVWSMLLGNIIIVALFLGKRYTKISWGYIERRQVWPAVGISVAIAATFLLALMSFYELIDFDNLIPTDTELMAERARQHYSGIAGILYGCLLGPLAEEIGFRGVLLGGLLKTRCRPWLAILISAFFFGLFHGFVGFFGAMLFGVVLGWLYWRTGSLIPGTIVHIVNNSLSFIDLSGQTNTVCLIVLVGSLVVLTFGLRWFGIKVNPKNTET